MIVVEELVEVVLTKTNNFFQKYRVVLISSISILVIRQEAYFSKAKGSGTPAPIWTRFSPKCTMGYFGYHGVLDFSILFAISLLKKVIYLIKHT